MGKRKGNVFRRVCDSGGSRISQGGERQPSWGGGANLLFWLAQEGNASLTPLDLPMLSFCSEGEGRRGTLNKLGGGRQPTILAGPEGECIPDAPRSANAVLLFRGRGTEGYSDQVTPPLSPDWSRPTLPQTRPCQGRTHPEPLSPDWSRPRWGSGGGLS